ncbi:MAG: cobalt ECF transporter T component CbiQ [Methanoculleaceae archaeon]
MYEELLEDLAQTSGLRGINTWLKLAVGLGAIVLCLLSKSYIPPLFISLLLAAAILGPARIDPRTYAELFILPCTFCVMGVAVIILVAGGGEVYWSWNLFPWLSLSITSGSINTAALVFSRVTGGMSGLIFIALTTPMTDLFAVMRRCHIPVAVVDLTMIIYRSIFIIMDRLVTTYHAQLMRLGYSSFSESVRSFATLCGSTFIASWETGESFIRAMDARCYSGKFVVLGETQPVTLKHSLAAGVFLVTSAFVVYACHGITLI